MSDKYGINYLLEAIAFIKAQNIIPVKLRIAGKGPKEEDYKHLTRQLGIDDITTWLGFISQEKASEEWANMDVAVIPSVLESESFGVSAVEAQACGTPVIISDIPGLMEAVQFNSSAIIVPRKNAKALAEAIERSYYSAGKSQGIQCAEHYEIGKCFREIECKFQAIGSIR